MLSGLLAILEGRRQELGRLGELVLAVAHHHLVLVGGGARLVVELDGIVLAGLELQRLRRGLVQQALATIVVLEGPVAVNRVVDLLAVEAGLGKLAVALGQVRHRIAALGRRADHERIQTRDRMLEVLGEAAVGCLHRELGGLDDANIIERRGTLTGFAAQAERCSVVLRGELNVRASHVGVLALIAGGVVLDHRATKATGDLLLAALNRNRSRRVGLVCHIHLGHVGLTLLKAGQLGGNRNVLRRVGDGELLVAVLIVLYGNSVVGDSAAPNVLAQLLALIVGVKAGVDHAGALAELNGVGRLGLGVGLGDHIRGLGLGIDGHLATGHVGYLHAPLVGELVQSRAALEARGQIPGGGSAVHVVVVQLVVAILLPR